MQTSIDFARQGGRRIVAVTVVESPHPGAYMLNVGSRCAWTVEQLRKELLEEATERSRAAASIVPVDISVESRVVLGRPDRLIRRLAERRTIAHLVVHDGWSSKRWMRRALREWEIANLPVEMA